MNHFHKELAHTARTVLHGNIKHWMHCSEGDAFTQVDAVADKHRTELRAHLAEKDWHAVNLYLVALKNSELVTHISVVKDVLFQSPRNQKHGTEKLAKQALQAINSPEAN